MSSDSPMRSTALSTPKETTADLRDLLQTLIDVEVENGAYLKQIQRDIAKNEVHLSRLEDRAASSDARLARVEEMVVDLQARIARGECSSPKPSWQ